MLLYGSIFDAAQKHKNWSFCCNVDRTLSVIHIALAIYNTYVSLISNFGNTQTRGSVGWWVGVLPGSKPDFWQRCFFKDFQGANISGCTYSVIVQCNSKLSSSDVFKILNRPWPFCPCKGEVMVWTIMKSETYLMSLKFVCMANLHMCVLSLEMYFEIFHGPVS